ncbi:MAG: hypothetical protein KAI50_07460 [Desulfobacterales bacterium]|nr:hypothetical protein [Desulfobacterales bacterium]
MIKQILSLVLIALPCLALAENRDARESVENKGFDKYEEKREIDEKPRDRIREEIRKYEEKREIDEKRRDRIREEIRKETDGNRSLEHGDPCLIEPSLPGCSSSTM